jgi:hypothetical protein
MTTKNGNIGIGTAAPGQRLDVAGKVKISNDATTPAAGAIRWSGTDFEGYDGTKWVSLTFNRRGSGGSQRVVWMV